ncbi:oral-facial-digital syndrome 1 protein homolog isoform X2 [Anguilla anguilla]|uniref:oral-facial-digital syndrome 1 protein homolog isoform X2 n=1 Tax=Anguilla anguilla TaxID=7936 RepID=UPI0015AF480D|nr:oral-facial-digital syndrome 1 protein homolog isoform X2 [Anguilla anguilla]
MSGVKEEVISPDEMRKRLYKTFKNRGVLDTLKTQLRNQLIHELKHPVLSREYPVRPVLPEPDSVLVTASNSLVVGHLQRAGYEYSLSVFYPECGLDKDKVFSTRDLLQLLKISPRSSLYKSLTSSIQNDNQKGFLMKLLIELSDHHAQRERCDADTQTSSSPPYRESLVEKMQMIDDEYASLRHRGDRWESLEAKLAEYRKEAQAQAQEEVKAKLQHFKDVELAKMKLEEQEKSRKEIQELRRDLERTYQLKSEALINREKNAIERLQKQQEIEEKEIYMQRQLVLKEIDAVRNREVDLRQRTEAFEKGCKLQQEKARAMEELLGRRELAVKTLEETYDQKLKNELTRYQLDLKEEYLQRTQKVAEDERRNKEEKVRLQKEAASVSAKAEEHRQACAELQRLQVALDTALAQVSLVTQQNELLKERLEAARDYPTLKRERVELQAQLRLLKKTLEEAQEENHHLRTDLSKPSKEQLVLQTELRRVQNARRLDEEDFENQKQLLQVQLQTEAERCAQLKAQLAECEERTQRVTSHAEDVKMQLRQTQLALENEVLRCPKPSLVDRSVLDLAPDKLVPPDIYVDPAVLRSRAQDDPYGPGRRPQWARSASSDSDTELVAGAKARIRELEKEAESLEEAYRSYQQRALRAAVSGIQPPRTFSPPPLPQQRPPHRPRAAPGHAPQTRVTFAQEPPPPSLLPGYGSSLPFEAQSPELGSSPPRRLSSTPLSIAKRLIRYAAEEDAQSSPVTFRGLSPERQLSPIPHSETGVAASSSTSLPGSPALKSTARGPIGSQKAQEVASSSGSSPSPPEKITLDDLTEPSQGPAHIPELPQDLANQPAEEPERGRSITPTSQRGRSITPTSQREGRVSQTSPRVRSATPPETVGSPSVHQQEMHQFPEEAGSGPHREEEEDEEMQWELERKRREEKRQQEREEAMERQRRELDRLEQEKRLEEQRQEQEVVSGEGGERTDGEREELRQEQEVVSEERGERTEEEREELGVGPVEKRGQEDPLQKYMRMVMEGKSPKKEETEGSPEAEILSDEKDNSIAAFSHDDPDEDFW